MLAKAIARSLNERGYVPRDEEYDPGQDPVVRNCLALMACAAVVMLYAVGQAWQMW